MREIFAAAQQPADPGRVFYTITAADVGHGMIHTEIGIIHVHDFMGRVQAGDVGKRIYRVLVGYDHDRQPVYIWQVENDHQYQRRRAQEAGR